MDERFQIVKHDHRFRPIRQKQRKVQIDKRFHGIFTKKRFQENFTVDKRGRPIQESTSKNLRRFYHLSKSERKRIYKERLKSREALRKQLNGQNQQEENVSESQTNEQEITQEKERKISDTNDVGSDSSYFSSEDEDSDIDLARGKGNIESSSEEEDDIELELSNNNNIPDPGWGEMDNSAPRSEETSNRLALCGMDWDRVRASDLYILLDSFKSSSGIIRSVTIYPSEYGVQRMAEEAKMGPAELKEMKSDELENEWHKEEDEHYNMEKLRQYQLNRLKYYYAVIDCDSVTTAEKLYQECDGIEFETSCSKIDLRFIPDGMEFNDYPAKETANSMPDLLTYKPISFITAALNQTRVDLTWDETDRKRTALTKSKFTREQLENMDVKDFLASGSESESDTENAFPDSGTFESKSNMDEKERMEMYRKLLLGDDNEDKENDINMEITWEPDLKSTVEQDLIKEKTKKKEKVESTKEENQTEETSKAELEMIMLEDDIGDKESNNEFEIDLNDERFSALYKTPNFAIDRSSSMYRKTDAMEKLVQERQSQVTNNYDNESGKTIKPVCAKQDGSLDALVRSVKVKSAQFGNKSKKLKNN